MNIKHKDPEIVPDTPFANCKLDRKKYADVLTKIVDTYSDGFVLAINNEWGTGKTIFVKMWNQLLINEGFKTLYFNAWENDFDVNPLAAILAELKKLIPQTENKTFNSLLNKGAVLAQNVLPSIAKGLAKRYIDMEELTDGIENITKATTEILKDEIKRYTARQKGLSSFRKELEKYVKQEQNPKPLIFIIDELDRCRPTYAVEVLEQMKHFFTVPGIVFVLAIDKIQLGNAVKGVYGSEQLNANEYLRRFIDIEYTIPAPSTSVFCNYLYDYYGFVEFFQSEERRGNKELHGERENFLDFASMLFESKNFTLRQQEKIFAHARLALKTFQSNIYVFPSAFICLIYLNSYHNEFYLNIKTRRLNLQGFIDELEKIFKGIISENNFRLFVYTEALLLHFYYNFYREIYNEAELMTKSNADQEQLMVTSSFESNNLNSLLLQFLKSFRRGNTDYIKLNFLLNRVDLVEKIN